MLAWFSDCYRGWIKYQKTLEGIALLIERAILPREGFSDWIEFKENPSTHSNRETCTAETIIHRLGAGDPLPCLP